MSLNELGFSHIWTNQTDLKACSKFWFKNAVKLRVQDQFLANWRAKVFNSSSCNVYRMFKHSLVLEPYLYSVPINIALKVIKFRCRNNFIPVSRVNFVSDINLYCPMCNTCSHCDEVHLLLECNYFRQDRLTSLGRYKFRTVNSEVYSDVMNVKCAKNCSNSVNLFPVSYQYSIVNYMHFCLSYFALFFIS